MSTSICYRIQGGTDLSTILGNFKHLREQGVMEKEAFRVVVNRSAQYHAYRRSPRRKKHMARQLDRLLHAMPVFEPVKGLQNKKSRLIRFFFG